MGVEQFANTPQTTLSADVTAVATSISVTIPSPNPFPAIAPFRILIDNEIMLVTAMSGGTWTVTRAVETNNGAATAASHTSGTTVTCLLTAGAVSTARQATVKQETQASHGFSVGKWVYWTGSAYALAKSDVADTSEARGVVSAVINTDIFCLTSDGYVDGLSGLTAGDEYWLSDSSAGDIMNAAPTTLGHIDKPVFFATYSTSGWVKISRGITVVSAAFLQTYPGNVLINGGLDFAQRQDPRIYTTIGSAGTDAYSADRWKVACQTNNVQYIRTDTAGSPESGMTSRFYGSWKQITAAGKFCVYQILEGINTSPLQGRNVILQGAIKASSSKTVRLGLGYLNSSGTIDSLPAALVTTWGANSTDPTLGTNLAYITPSSIPSGVAGSISGGGVNCSVTTSWAQFAGVFNVPANCLNLVAMVWTDSQFSANDILSLAQFGIYDGSTLQPWLPRAEALELALCQRYYEKNYNLDTAPGTATTDGILYLNISTTAVGTNGLGLGIRLQTPKFSVPTITFYDSAGNAGKIDTLNAGWHTGGAPDTGISPTQQGFYFGSPGGVGVSKNGIRAHFTADADL